MRSRCVYAEGVRAVGVRVMLSRVAVAELCVSGGRDPLLLACHAGENSPNLTYRARAVSLHF